MLLEHPPGEQDGEVGHVLRTQSHLGSRSNLPHEVVYGLKLLGVVNVATLIVIWSVERDGVSCAQEVGHTLVKSTLGRGESCGGRRRYGLAIHRGRRVAEFPFCGERKNLILELRTRELRFGWSGRRCLLRRVMQRERPQHTVALWGKSHNLWCSVKGSGVVGRIAGF